MEGDTYVNFKLSHCICEKKQVRHRRMLIFFTFITLIGMLCVVPGTVILYFKVLALSKQMLCTCADVPNGQASNQYSPAQLELQEQRAVNDDAINGGAINDHAKRIKRSPNEQDGKVSGKKVFSDPSYI